MNSIISWVGGKKALRDLIYQCMPKEYERYIEVFGGGGWVLFGSHLINAWRFTTILIQILQIFFIVSKNDRWPYLRNCPFCRSTPEMNLSHYGNFS